MIIHRPGLPTLYVDEPESLSPKPRPLSSIAQTTTAATHEIIPAVPQKPLIENTKGPT